MSADRHSREDKPAKVVVFCRPVTLPRRHSSEVWESSAGMSSIGSVESSLGQTVKQLGY